MPVIVFGGVYGYVVCACFFLFFLLSGRATAKAERDAFEAERERVHDELGAMHAARAEAHAAGADCRAEQVSLVGGWVGEHYLPARLSASIVGDCLAAQWVGGWVVW